MIPDVVPYPRGRAMLSAGAGPTHPYIGASPGCCAPYGEALAKEYGELRYPPVHRLTVAACNAQHPGTPSPWAIRSVAIDLIGLCLALEREAEPAVATAGIGRVASRRPTFPWLPPDPLGVLTILDVHGPDPGEHTERVERWADTVWRAWAPHHAMVREWAEEASEPG